MNDITGAGFTISCDDCAMQCTDACDDCVVTFLIRDDAAADDTDVPLVLDVDQVRVVRLFGHAGLVPDLKYSVAG